METFTRGEENYWQNLLWKIRTAVSRMHGEWAAVMRAAGAHDYRSSKATFEEVDDFVETDEPQCIKAGQTKPPKGDHHPQRTAAFAHTLGWLDDEGAPPLICSGNCCLATARICPLARGGNQPLRTLRMVE